MSNATVSKTTITTNNTTYVIKKHQDNTYIVYKNEVPLVTKGRFTQAMKYVAETIEYEEDNKPTYDDTHEFHRDLMRENGLIG